MHVVVAGRNTTYNETIRDVVWKKLESNKVEELSIEVRKISHYILFNPIKPKGYKLYLPTVLIGSDALKCMKESKYLGYTFSDYKCDDCDMLRQMRR